MSKCGKDLCFEVYFTSAHIYRFILSDPEGSERHVDSLKLHLNAQ